MSFKHLVMLVLLVVTFACGPYWSHAGLNGTMNDSGTWNVCIDLPSDQLAAAHAAVEAWDTALSQWVHVRAIDGGKQSYCRVWVHMTTKPNIDTPIALAWANAVGGNEVSMMVGRYEQDVSGILLHELGHAFGAQHVAHTLMNPSWSVGAFACPDKITVVQIAAWNHVNLDLLKWCYY